MPGHKSLAERGHAAALAYIERVGMSVVEDNHMTSEGLLEIIATEDDGTLVGFEVVTTTEQGWLAKTPEPRNGHSMCSRLQAYRREAGLSAPIRCDIINIRAIGEDRALLRHHRAAYSTE